MKVCCMFIINALNEGNLCNKLIVIMIIIIIIIIMIMIMIMIIIIISLLKQTK